MPGESWLGAKKRPTTPGAPENPGPPRKKEGRATESPRKEPRPDRNPHRTVGSSLHPKGVPPADQGKKVLAGVDPLNGDPSRICPTPERGSQAPSTNPGADFQPPHHSARFRSPSVWSSETKPRLFVRFVQGDPPRPGPFRGRERGALFKVF
jgi:hypothetical protein